MHRPVDRPANPQIGLYCLDLPNIAERLQVAGLFGPPRRHPDAVAAFGQRPDDVPAQKAGTAKHGNEFGDLQDLGHIGLR